MAAVAQPQSGWQPPQGFHQHGQQKKPEFSPEQFVKEMKNFITREAKLTQEEADKFFPMLFEMNEKTREIQQKRRELSMKAHMGEQQMTEAQYASTVAQMCKLEVMEKQVEQTYYKKFHSVLSWKKIYKVRNAISMFHMRAIGMFQRGKRPGLGAPPRQ